MGMNIEIEDDRVINNWEFLKGLDGFVSDSKFLEHLLYKEFARRKIPTRPSNEDRMSYSLGSWSDSSLGMDESEDEFGVDSLGEPFQMMCCETKRRLKYKTEAEFRKYQNWAFVCSNLDQLQFECCLCKKFFTKEDVLVQNCLVHGMKTAICITGCFRLWKPKVPKPKKPAFNKEKNPCPTCGEKFDSKSELDAHQSKHNLVSCELCAKKFLHKETLKKHMRNHTVVKNFKCDKCDEAFEADFERYNHSLIHSQPKIKCPICCKIFQEDCKLKEHLAGFANGKTFTCEFCERGFHSHSGLKSHLRMHSVDKKYVCVICDRAYATTKELEFHIRCEYSVERINQSRNRGLDPFYFRNSELSGSPALVVGEKQLEGGGQ